MNAKVTIDKAGRVVLPKALRDKLDLAPGDTLDLTVEGEQVTLRPHRLTPPLQRERGIWVFRTGEAITAGEIRSLLQGMREQRGLGKLGDAR